MQKRPDLGFAFVDLTGRYGSADIKTQLAAAAAPAPAPAPDAT
jgi:hypothetical protein